MAGDRFVADDRDPGIRPQRFDALAKRTDDAAPDHNVVATRPKRDIDDDGLAGPQWRGHDEQSPPAAVAGSAPANPRCLASTLIISSTIFSCTTSRD